VVKDVHGVVVLKISEVKACQHECGTFIWPIVNINNSSMLCSLFLAKINLNSCMTVDIWSSFSLVTIFPFSTSTTGHLCIGMPIEVHHRYTRDIEMTIE
jgi:hypothetical protein